MRALLLLEEKALMGWQWRQAGARLYRGVQLTAGVKIYPYEVLKRGKIECVEKPWDYKEVGSRRHERVDVMREALTMGWAASRWGWPAPHVGVSG